MISIYLFLLLTVSSETLDEAEECAAKSYELLD